MHGNSSERRALEREALRNVINQWNANRLDLFELSEPNEDLEFHGVMRFYFQDSGQKVATKCIRVASDATVEDVIGTLIEKFRPDMRMLSIPSYALYELHEGCNERRMLPDEKPLLVQLNWHVDDREGRFLLRNIDDKTVSSIMNNNNNNNTIDVQNESFRRKLSKREKKQLKKQEKLARMKSENGSVKNKNGVAEKLYTELPETSFTRSISNPEAVMRRRRQQKLEQKLQQFRSKDGKPDTGGTLKIYGEALCKDVPYKTLLVSVRDCAGSVVREMLEKYGLQNTDPGQWCLVQVTQQPGGGGPDLEYVLDDDECPLSILMNCNNTTSSIMFHVRRRPSDCAPRKRKKKPGVLTTMGTASGVGPPSGTTTNGVNAGSSGPHHHHHRSDSVPILVELAPDGTVPNPCDTVRTLRLTGDIMEVGSANGIALQLYGPHIQSRHCVLKNVGDGSTTVTPSHPDAMTFVNGQRIYQSTVLTHGTVIRFGHCNTYRFLDPAHDERTTSPAPARENIETTFDLEGNVETISMASGARDDNRSLGSTSENRSRGYDPILPAVLEFPEDNQEQFLARVITHLDVNIPTFPLAPAFTLYLCARYRASTHYRPELTPTERAHKLTVILQHAAILIRHTVQERSAECTFQAFWLANASELLHFLKSDRHVSAFSLQAQDILADTVQLAFRHLVTCLTDDLAAVAMTYLMSATGDDHPREVVTCLSSGMLFLRKCRVNAALTIQLFSQLFHWIAAKALGTVITNSNLCTRSFGNRLFNRLRNLQLWAESQGLELAAECHLAKIIQCAHLLQSVKYTPEDLANLSSACFKLNSLQLGALLMQYKPEPNEKLAPQSLLEQAAKAAENVADELTRAEGREVTLYDDPVAALQLLLPDDGYSCDVVQGLPPGLGDFILPLQGAGLCRLAVQPTSSGHWTVYMSIPRPASALSTNQPEVQMIRLHKAGGGMGLSIVAAKGAGQERLGIYIKSVVPGGAADRDGRLAAGDQLLAVDGQSLLGITQEKAAEYLVRTGAVVSLEVAKGGAVYHGLATLLQQPSPTPQRGPRRMSERDLPSRIDLEQQQQSQQPNNRPMIPISKSVPAALHHISSPSGTAVPSNVQHLGNSILSEHYPPQQHPNQFARPPPDYLVYPDSNNLLVNGPNNAGRSRSVHNLHQTDSGFYQNLSVYNRNKVPSPQQQYLPHLGDRSSNLRSSQNSLQSLQSNPHLQRPSSGYYPQAGNIQKNPPPPPPPLPPHSINGVIKSDSPSYYLPNGKVMMSPPNVDTMRFAYDAHQQMSRGQAKLLEMSEEVRRRQNRISNNNTSPAYYYDVQRLNQNVQNLHLGTKQHSPPTAPPKPLAVKFEPPPEPPPTNTHPLYSASTQDLPKMAFYGPVASGQRAPARDPWTREEQERQAEVRREVSRQWQEQQIRELTAMPNKSIQQEEQLRVLQLEREFQRRAIEAAGGDEDDDDNNNNNNNKGKCEESNSSDFPLPPPPPEPPERGSSYAIMSLRTTSRDGGPTVVSNNSKKVSFNDVSSTSPPPPPPPPHIINDPVPPIREDPNKFFKAADALLAASPTTPTEDDDSAGLRVGIQLTPGVIGAQEVYRDPRLRRLAEQAQQKNQNATTTVPEKLSFKEKMKMFAMDAGEHGTPRDKSKISRAQRDIDNLGSPAPNSGLVH